MTKNPLIISLILSYSVSSSICCAERMPFYEDFLENSDLPGFLDEAKKFLEESPDAPEAPRIAMDYLIVGKAVSRPPAVDYATDLLMFRYPQSLPGLQFLSSFEKGSPRLLKLLALKAEQGNLGDKDFAVTYCRTLLFIARIQGPELLKDSSLRLRVFLLATLAGVDEIKNTALPSLEKLAETDSPLGNTLKIVFDDTSPLDKIEKLASLPGGDAKFCLAYYLAQLAPEQAESDKIKRVKINQILFGKTPDTTLVRELINSLPLEIRQSSYIQALLAFSHHLDEDTDKAIAILNDTKTKKESPSDWEKSVKSYADGLAFLENRKKLLVQAMGKAVDRLDADSTCMLIKAEWSEQDEPEINDVNYLTIAIDKTKSRFEIQLRKNQEFVLGYKSDDKSSSILGPDSAKTFSFLSPGAYPVPRVGIVRDSATGSFNYNFNLTFAPSFNEFVEAGSTIIENPYIGTDKGREVFWSYTLGNKFIWLEPAKTANGGTSFPISSLSIGATTPLKSSLTFDLEGNLKSARVGRFTLSSIKFGNSEILNEIPSWPKTEVEKIQDFDFSMFMKLVSRFSTSASI